MSVATFGDLGNPVIRRPGESLIIDNRSLHGFALGVDRASEEG